MRISIKLEGVDEAMRMYDHKIVRSALKSSLKKIVKQGKTEGSAAIREKFNLSKRDVDRKLKVRVYGGAGSSSWAEISVKGRSIGLLNFGAKAIRGRSKITRAKDRTLTRTTLKRRGKVQGVQAKVSTIGAKLLMPNAFIARGMRGKTGLTESNAQVWQRTDRGLVPKRIISVASMFGQKRVQDRIAKRISTKWPGILTHELKRRLDKRK